jgi:hypothetical protein
MKHLIAVAVFVCVSWVMPPAASAQTIQHKIDCLEEKNQWRCPGGTK